MTPAAASDGLRKSLDPKKRDFTIADAAAGSGLSLVSAETGLHALVAEYRGHLRVTEEGELLFRFPHGFEKPWVTTGLLARWARAVGRGLEGIARFVVRAWVAIVLVGYVAVFLALAIALLFARQDRDSGRGGFVLFHVVFRLVAEAFFWTLHPFSPFYAGADFSYGRRRTRSAWEREDRGPPFYERVDRFFFGPKAVPEDPMAAQRAVLAEIRAGKGRIGLADVMRVTGRPRDEVDPMMSRLMLDYGGSVEVSEEGGIAYRFPALRKTVDEMGSARPRAIWEERAIVPPITGNPIESNLLIGALNAFNLVASGLVLASGLTIERMFAIVRELPPEQIPAPGLPIALGLVPFVFSVLLFLLPIGRLLLRGRKRRQIERENGRREVLRAVLESAKSGGISDEELKQRYRIAANAEPTDQEITKQVVALGGDVDLERAEQGIRYRFLDLELEAKAVEAEREAADESEAKVGKIVFSSED